MKKTVAGIFNLYHASLATRSFSDDYSRVAIYGAGNIGKDVYEALWNRCIPVEFFLDRKACPGDTWKGVPILQPDDSALSMTDRERVNVIIAILNPEVDISVVGKTLSDLGYTQVTNLVRFYDHFGDVLGDRFWLTSRSFYEPLESVLSEGLSVWADASSRQLFLSNLEYRMTGNAGCLPLPDNRHQYFPPDLPRWQSPIRFIDCGAYHGDTLASILDAGFEIEAALEFEPDQENFRKLLNFVNNRKLSSVYLWPCAVFSSTTKIHFHEGKGEASRLSNSGEVIIQGVALDEVVPKFNPSLIKMDIEGAEYEALLGARNLICESRPGLAISVYHQPAHLWSLAHLLLEWNAGYKLYLRSHAYNGFELVMYAIPF